MPRLSVAFVEFYRQWPGYFCDSFNASFAGALRSAGHSTRIYKCFQHVNEDANLALLEDGLRADGPGDLIVVDRIWSRHLLEALARSPGNPEFVVMQWESPAHWTELKWRISPTSRTGLVQFVEALASTSEFEPSSITNLHWRDEMGTWHNPGKHAPLNVSELFAEPLDLAYDAAEVIGLSSNEAAQTRYLVMNMGCPYRTARNDSGFLKDLDLPTEWGDAGCTFCNVGRYEVQTKQERSELMNRQLQALSVHGRFTRLVVQDEYIFRDLDVLVDAAMEHCQPGLDIMVRARVAYLESCNDVLVRALKRFDGFGTITPYLVGFENFSDDELKRYNKGQSAEEGMDAVRKLEELSQTYPNLRHSPSQGFILFGPWTSMEDLERNLEALRAVSFGKYRGSVTRSKLRLNPDAALVTRASADGLLVNAYTQAHQDNAAGTGYQAEIPYRFLHDDVARVWDLLNGDESVDGTDEFDRLERAIAIARSETA